MHRLIASLMMALIGAALFAAFVLQDIKIHPETEFADLPWNLILRYALAMTAGGALVGFMFCGLFGRNGVLGWVLALIGGVIAASISGLFGSAFGLLPDLLADGFSTSDAVQVAAGLLILPLAAIEQPMVLVIVLALIVVTHLWCNRARQSH